MVLLRSLVVNNGQYKKNHYENLFRQHFGYGGRYVGYIDRPTRDTLDNITTVENEALQRAEAIPFNGDSNSKHMMITKELANSCDIRVFCPSHPSKHIRRWRFLRASYLTWSRTWRYRGG